MTIQASSEVKKMSIVGHLRKAHAMKNQKSTFCEDSILNRICTKPDPKWNREDREMNTVLCSGDLILDEYGRRVYKQGKELKLSEKQFRVVQLLMSNATMICSRDSLSNVILWPETGTLMPNTLTKQINRIRDRLGRECDERPYIRTVNTLGYQWNFPVYKAYINREPWMLED